MKYNINYKKKLDKKLLQRTTTKLKFKKCNICGLEGCDCIELK